MVVAIVGGSGLRRSVADRRISAQRVAKSEAADQSTQLVSRWMTHVVGPLGYSYVVRYPGPEPYGRYASVVAVTALLRVLCDFGSSRPTCRYTGLAHTGPGVVLRVAILLGCFYVVVVWGTEDGCGWHIYERTIAALALLISVGVSRRPQSLRPYPSGCKCVRSGLAWR